ncbi:MAG: class I SAM-dependent methyltransferase [Candidatus Omnitrophota bacterium]
MYFDIDITSKQEFKSWPHTPTYQAVKLIRPNSKVLDVGCSKGYMAKELNKKGCKVTGVEIDKNAARAAKNYCVDVINADIEKQDELPCPENSFDYILCLDVLEHLMRPDVILNKLKRYLSPNGEIIISIPNIARFEHRLKLLSGIFDYSECGALSKGHLRFFTYKTAKVLIESSGYKIKAVKSTGLGFIIKIFPGLFAFQFLIIAKKA